MELEAEPTEENDNREMETVPEQIPLAEEEEMPFRMSPLSHPGPELREDFLELPESSRKDAGNIEIMDMVRLIKMRSIKKEMKEREDKWEKHQQIKEEFLEVEFRRKEQLFEHNLRQREEEWKEEMKKKEK